MTGTSESPRRLDVALAAAGLARSRSHARELIRAGYVTVGGQVERRPAAPVTGVEHLQVAGDAMADLVSRAGGKLRGALADLEVPVPARCADIGSSTGGFTQVLLSEGAERVFAVDVGTDQLHPDLRADPRVSVREQTNARTLTVADLDGQPVDLVVADVSFISLTLLLEPILGILTDSGAALLMVKPQFEVGRQRVGPGGVVRDPELQREAVAQVQQHAEALGWSCRQVAPSRVPGPAGNLEFFCHFVGPRAAAQ